MSNQESKVERHLHVLVSLLDGTTRKWVSPGYVSVPDRIAFIPGEPVYFIEVKISGKKPTGAQWREIIRLMMLGQNAGYLAGINEVDQFIESNNRVEWLRRHVLDNININKLKQDQKEWVNDNK